eukprot:gnl/MRDRNA2_/MRDRNA2_186060_c0_seq1.p1 gnl/MRDRNA2_/MRDRNA2_186060_c0~~gnl/MRDRNA2_/MRDRNA2_186060_c0_seq1.p1  ORF type:complete len:264 (-),score=41.98 gnl/MRDRNA2_/MRDRNA2_186060_c0_seq1:113-868(-)
MVDVAEYVEAAEAATRAKILALGQEAGLPKENACEVYREDGTRGIIWISTQEMPSHLRKRLHSSGGALKQANFEQYLKEGLRAMAEREDQSMRDFAGLYSQCIPSAWWFELLVAVLRLGFAVILIMPKGIQEVAGAGLSLIIFGCTAYIRPYRRNSDTLMMVLAYGALAMFFVLHGRPVFQRSEQCVTFCLSVPLLLLLYYVLKAYVLPSRHKLWSSEAARLGFAEEFCRARQASTSHRKKARAWSESPES